MIRGCVTPLHAKKLIRSHAPNQPVIARPADQRVIALTARENIGRGAALQPIGRHRASSDETGSAGVGQIFDICAEDIARQGGLHQIAALAQMFDHGIKAAVHDIGVVVTPPGHVILARPAIQRVIPPPAEELVLARTAQKPVIPVLAIEEIIRAITGQDVIALPAI